MTTTITPQNLAQLAIEAHQKHLAQIGAVSVVTQAQDQSLRQGAKSAFIQVLGVEIEDSQIYTADANSVTDESDAPTALIVYGDLNFRSGWWSSAHRLALVSDCSVCEFTLKLPFSSPAELGRLLTSTPLCYTCAEKASRAALPSGRKAYEDVNNAIAELGRDQASVPLALVFAALHIVESFELIAERLDRLADALEPQIEYKQVPGTEDRMKAALEIHHATGEQAAVLAADAYQAYTESHEKNSGPDVAAFSAMQDDPEYPLMFDVEREATLRQMEEDDRQ